MVMAQQKQDNDGSSHTGAPGASKLDDSLRKLELQHGQNKKTTVGPPNVDHMPIARPDMKKFNMPVASPGEDIKHLDTSKVRKKLKLQPAPK